jgi:hypothetical protein
MRWAGGNIDSSGGQRCLAAAGDDQAWNLRHGKKAQVGGKVCMRQGPTAAGGS